MTFVLVFPMLLRYKNELIILEDIMDATFGLFLVIGFPLCLVIVISLFGRFSVDPE
jgi:hypothetical protein